VRYYVSKYTILDAFPDEKSELWIKSGSLFLVGFVDIYRFWFCFFEISLFIT